MQDYQQQRAYLLLHFQHYRIVQPNVVFLHGLPDALSSTTIIRKQVSKFGHVVRVSSQPVGKDFHSAFIQFESEINAALLLILLDGYLLMNRTLRVFYGSTKFCPHFLKGHVCRLKQCNYSHYFHPLLVHLKEQAKQVDHQAIAREQLLRCFQDVSMLQYVNQLFEKQQNCKDLLPLSKHKYHKFLTDYNWSQIQSQASICQAESELQTQLQTLQELPRQTTNEATEWKEIQHMLIQHEISTVQPDQRRLPSPRIQQFLDGAERFLTNLIFSSKQFIF